MLSQESVESEKTHRVRRAADGETKRKTKTRSSSDVGLSDLEGQDSDESAADLGDGLLDVESRDSDVEDQDFGTAQFGCSCFRPR